MVATTLRRRRSKMYGVVVPPPPSAPPDFYVWASECGAGYRYSGVEDQEQIAFDVCIDADYRWLDPVPPQSWMVGETEVSVEAGEAVMSWGPGSINPIGTFDLRLDGASYSTPNTVSMTPAVYHGGFLWWVEVDNDGGLTFTLRRSRPDLSEVTTVATGAVADPSGGAGLKWISSTPAIAVADDAVLSEWQWGTDTIGTFPAEGVVRIRWELPGGSFSSTELAGTELTFDRGLSAPEGGFVWADGAELQHSGGSTALGLAWAGDYYPSGSDPRQVAAERVSPGPDGVFALFGDLGGGRGFAVAPSGGPHASAPATDLYQLDPPPEGFSQGIGFMHREGP